jgi:hypothetical protein
MMLDREFVEIVLQGFNLSARLAAGAPKAQNVAAPQRA